MISKLFLLQNVCIIVIINVIRYIMTVFLFSTIINIGRGGLKTMKSH